MNFDEELKRAVDTLGDRLRDDISRELRLLTDDLAASAKADREAAAGLAADAATEAAEAVARARAEEAASQAADAERAAVEAVRAEQAAAGAESLAAAAASSTHHADAHADDAEAIERLVNAIRAIDRARSLSEVLDALLASAGLEAARAGVLLVRDGRVRGWRFTGFAPSFDGTAVDLALGESGIIAHAVEHQQAASSESDGAAPAFAELGEHADSTEAIAIPMTMAGEVVAVLYVDQPDAEPGILTLEPAALEVLARHAARALESLTAFKAARSITRADEPPAGAGLIGSNGGSRGPAADDEHEAARRYARLVISEIKLYHQDAVNEGRRDGNLAARLGGEIARARALYEQRVPAHLHGAAGHFHAELVRTLADGDESLFTKASLS